MFFEQYLGCYRSIFSQMLICYSWEYTLAAECTLYFEFEGYRRIIFKNPRVVLFAIWCKFVQIHAYLKTVIAPYIGWVETPKLYFIFWKPMSWEYEYMHDLADRMLWRNHIGSWTLKKKWIFHWWRHDFLCSIEVISLTGDQFSPKFWYVVAETCLNEKTPSIFHFDDVVIVEFSTKGDNS